MEEKQSQSHNQHSQKAPGEIHNRHEAIGVKNRDPTFLCEGVTRQSTGGLGTLHKLAQRHSRPRRPFFESVRMVVVNNADFVLGVVAFVYALYAVLIFFAVILMWVFSILVTIYVSVSSDKVTWAQVFAVGLGIPLIGPIVNVLEEILVLLLRVIRMGFQSKLRSSVFESVCVPTSFDDSYFLLPPSERSAFCKNSRRERLAWRLTSFAAKIPPTGLSFQSKLSFVLLCIDIVTVIIFVSCSEDSYAYTVRSYACLLIMLLCAVVRFVRSAPASINEVNQRLSTSKSVRWVRYTTNVSAFFVLASCTCAGLFAHRPKVYEFTLASAAVYFGLLAILFVTILCAVGFAARSCISTFSPFFSTDEDARLIFGDENSIAHPEAPSTDQVHPFAATPAENNTETYAADGRPLDSESDSHILLDVLRRYTISGLFNMGSYIMIGVFFTAMLFVRGAGVGNFDSVPAGQRWWSVFVWLLIAVATFTHSFGGKERIWESEEDVHVRIASTEVEMVTTDVSTAGAEHRVRVDAPLPCEKKETDPHTPAQHHLPVTSQSSVPGASEERPEARAEWRKSNEGDETPILSDDDSWQPLSGKTIASVTARSCVSFIVCIFFLAVGCMCALNGTPALPPNHREYFERAVLEPKSPYPICGTRWGPAARFNVTDMIILSKVAYYPEASMVEQALRLWFDEPLNVTDNTNWIPKYANSSGHQSTYAEPTSIGVRAYHIVFHETSRSYESGLPANALVEPWMRNTIIQYPRLDIIAVRGSNNGIDWLQNAYIWGDSVFFSVFNILTPFLLPHSVVSSLISWSKSLRYGVFGDISYFHQLRELTLQVMADVGPSNRNSVLIVGHSLGGGMAQLIGSALQIDAFAVSGVGVGYQSGTSSFDVDDVRRHQTNIAGATDIVPKIDLQIGDFQNIACDDNFLMCHSLTNIWDEMARSCSDIRDISDASSKNSGPGEIISQLLIWAVTVIGSFIMYRTGIVKTSQKLLRVSCFQ